MIAYLTPEHRERAFKEGIYSWDDPKLDSELIGVNGKIGELVDAILDTNRDKSSKLVFFKNLDNSEGILNSDKLEYYIDFETILKNNVNFVYMIGLGYAHKSCGWVYKCFVLDELNEVSERKMYDQFITYIDTVNRAFKVNYQPLFYHWSSVEPNQLNKLITNLKLPVNNIKWFDLYKYFRDNVITVKGAFSHSLKSIGRGMFVNKLINTFWDESSLKDNKIGILAYNKYIRMNDTGEFDDVVKYNEVDCEIMYDILMVIRGLQ
jgi:predicted RecB family nuclease